MKWKNIIGGSRKFRANFRNLLFSNVGAQAIGLITLPILSRLFSPSEFGALSVFTTIYSIILAVSALRFDWLIPRAKGEASARALLKSGTLSVIGFSIAVLVLILILEYTDTVSSRSYKLAWLPTAVFSGGMLLLTQSRLIRNSQLKAAGTAKILQALATFLVSLFLYFLIDGKDALIGGYTVGLMTASLFLFIKAPIEINFNCRKQFRIFLSIIKRRRNEITAQVSSALINIALTSAPLLLLATFYTNKDAGSYSIAFRIAVAPLAIITSAVVYSFTAEASELIRCRSSEIYTFYNKTIRRLAVLGGMVACGVLAASIFLPAALGGEEWNMTGMYMAAVSPYLLSLTIFSPTTHLFLYGKSHWQLTIDISTLLLLIFIFVACSQSSLSPVIAIFMSSICLTLGYLARHKAHLIAIAKQQEINIPQDEQ